MNERFLIPSAVAVALHALVFLGFRAGDPPSVIAHGQPVVRPAPRPPDAVLIEWPLDSAPVASTEPLGKPNESRPELPEPPPRDPGPEITIPSNVPHVALPHPTSMIPVGLPGDSNGWIGQGGPGPVTPDHLDNPPRTRTQLAPVYPYEARKAGQPGEVMVEFVVDEGGRVRDPHVVRSNNQLFEEPTLRAVAKWRFEPGRKNGRIVRFRMAVPVAFAVNP